VHSAAHLGVGEFPVGFRAFVNGLAKFQGTGVHFVDAFLLAPREAIGGTTRTVFVHWLVLLLVEMQ
jgi:hypothetical protein